MADYSISRPGSVWVRNDEKDALRDLYSPIKSRNSSVSSVSSLYSDTSDTKGLVLSSYTRTYPRSENEQVPAGLLVNLSKARAVAVTITLSAGNFVHVSLLEIHSAQSLPLFSLSLTGCCILIKRYQQGYTQQAMFILLPIIKTDLNIPASHEGWVTAAYALGFSSAFLLMGRLGDVYGHRPVFLGACVLVLVMMVISPFLTNEWAFFAARGCHGIVSAHNIPNTEDCYYWILTFDRFLNVGSGGDV